MRAPLAIAACLVIAACAGPAVEVTEAPPTTLLLDRRPDLLVELELPEVSRAAPIPAEVALEFGPVRAVEGVEEYAADVEVRSVHYGQEERRQPPTMEVVDGDGRALSYKRAYAHRTWVYRKGQVVVRLRPGTPAPAGWRLRWPRGAEEEAALSQHTAGTAGADFALRSQALGRTTRHGVYLPAPAAAAWEVVVPEGGVLAARVHLLAPALGHGGRSDGAAAVVEVEVDGEVHEVARSELLPGQGRKVRADLGEWAGRTVRLRLRTEAGASGDLDYVFFSEPALYAPRDDPRRLLVVFADTLRPDHLGAYGYPRDTSPVIDALAARGVVFEAARSSSPWTLPGSRAMFTGRYPESWGAGPHLGDHLGRAGWASAALVGNVWLARAWGMDRGWSHYRANATSTAEDQLESARQVLAEYPDRDVALLVHFMEPHLPYIEPEPHRSLWAGERPALLPDDRPHEKDFRVAWAKADAGEREALREYAVDRYDQSVHHLDAVLAGFLDLVGEGAIVAVVSDHGEAFWENGVLGHGHDLFDEGLRIPLVIAAPRLEPGRVATPVSLVDLVPTLVDLAGGEATGADGRSLVPLVRGEALEARPLAFGQPCYGDDARGVLAEGRKWIGTGGAEHLYDLAADPAEEADMAAGADLAPWHRALGEALGREVWPVWRVAGQGSGTSMGRRFDALELRHPAGLAAAWNRPSSRHPLARPEVVDGAVRVEPARGESLPRELYLRPAGDAAAPEGLELRLLRGDEERLLVVDAPGEEVLASGHGLVITPSVQPAPVEAEAVPVLSADVAAELEALGYLGD